MRTNQTTPKVETRVSWVSNFVKVRGRLPTNKEISQVFRISIGGNTNYIIEMYLKSLKTCPFCKRNLNDRKM